MFGDYSGRSQRYNDVIVENFNVLNWPGKSKAWFRTLSEVIALNAALSNNHSTARVSHASNFNHHSSLFTKTAGISVVMDDNDKRVVSSSVLQAFPTAFRGLSRSHNLR